MSIKWYYWFNFFSEIDKIIALLMYVYIGSSINVDTDINTKMTKQWNIHFKSTSSSSVQQSLQYFEDIVYDLDSELDLYTILKLKQHLLLFI